MTEDLGFDSLQRQANFFSLDHSVQTNSETHPAYCVMVPENKRARHEADHSSPSSAKVKDGVIPPLPHTSSLLSA
jgi:hypothetical protein